MNPKDGVGAKKAPLRYVPPALYLEVSRIMENGANKYGPFNWREQPVSAVTYVEAALRHLFAWTDGQDNAEDSGLPHLAHAAASLGILLDAVAGGNMIDDRFTAGPAADILRRLDHSTPPPVIVDKVPSMGDGKGGMGLTLDDPLRDTPEKSEDYQRLIKALMDAMPVSLSDVKRAMCVGLNCNPLTPNRDCPLHGMFNPDYTMDDLNCSECGYAPPEHNLACSLFYSPAPEV